jgi:TRAP-type uncharacterized transport system fused permease subunit
MGTAAFIMAELLQISYAQVAIAAAIPALLYYLAVMFQVDLEAVKLGMKGLPKENLPRGRDVLKEIYFLLPIAVLVICLIVVQMSVTRSGILATLAAIVTSWLSKKNKMGPKQIFYAVVDAVKAASE